MGVLYQENNKEKLHKCELDENLKYDWICLVGDCYIHIKRFSVKRSEKKSVLFPKDYKKIVYTMHSYTYIDICIVSITAIQSNAHIACISVQTL